jgi:hypothetical protein
VKNIRVPAEWDARWYQTHWTEIKAVLDRIQVGDGDPEGVVIADVGSLYLRRDGSTSTTLYVKTADDGLATGWTAK